jgi:hypothetical protein
VLLLDVARPRHRALQHHSNQRQIDQLEAAFRRAEVEAVQARGRLNRSRLFSKRVSRAKAPRDNPRQERP